MKNKVINILDNLKNSINVYRTKNYIISQYVYVATNIDGQTILFSKDTFYLRNAKLDKIYNSMYSYRKNINGNRIHTTSHTRKYIF